MRWLAVGIVCAMAAAAVAADDSPTSAPVTSPSLCSNAPGAPPCKAPKKDLKAAREAFSRGLKLEKSGHIEPAFHAFEEAAALVPQDIEYLTARELTRQKLAAEHLERGNEALLKGQQVQALAEFRMAQT